MKIYLIVLNYCGKEDTAECVESLLRMEELAAKIVVVDNGSTDDSVAFLRGRFPGLAVIETGANLGYAEGNNVGIRFALEEGADGALLLNNDTVVAPDFLLRIREGAEARPGAIFGTRSYRYYEKTHFDHFGGIWDKRRLCFDLIAFHEEEREGSWQDFMPLDYVCGCAIFIPRRALEKVGLLEARYFLYFEEADWCFRARKAGFEVLFHPRAILWHKGSASLGEPKPPQAYYFWRNRSLFIERNYSKGAFMLAFLTKLLPQIGRLYLSKFLKDIQRLYLLTFKKDEWTEERRIRHLSYKTSIRGAKDYFLRRFGNGPSWIYARTSTRGD